MTETKEIKTSWWRCPPLPVKTDFSLVRWLQMASLALFCCRSAVQVRNLELLPSLWLSCPMVWSKHQKDASHIISKKTIHLWYNTIYTVMSYQGIIPLCNRWNHMTFFTQLAPMFLVNKADAIGASLFWSWWVWKSVCLRLPSSGTAKGENKQIWSIEISKTLCRTCIYIEQPNSNGLTFNLLAMASNLI